MPSRTSGTSFRVSCLHAVICSCHVTPGTGAPWPVPESWLTESATQLSSPSHVVVTTITQAFTHCSQDRRERSCTACLTETSTHLDKQQSRCPADRHAQAMHARPSKRRRGLNVDQVLAAVTITVGSLAGFSIYLVSQRPPERVSLQQVCCQGWLRWGCCAARLTDSCAGLPWRDPADQ